MKNVSPTGKNLKISAKPVLVPKKAETKPEPGTSAAIGALVAATVKDTKAEAKTKPAKTEPVKTDPAFVRAEQNGRKSYAPGSIGDQIWTAADALKEKLGTAQVTAAIVRLALPMLNARSVSCGLTHWRKFHGLTVEKLVAPVAPAVVTTSPAATAATF
jgi:hypothetical protein